MINQILVNQGLLNISFYTTSIIVFYQVFDVVTLSNTGSATILSVYTY
jgi:hypothetical protein